MKPLSVSVVIPCWRCADTVSRAVASVVAQSRPALEIILVDDASGDGTHDVLLNLARENPASAVRVLSLERNSGPGRARNAGWDVATGDVIAFLDADDAWHQRKLEIQVGWMERNADVALCGHRSAVISGPDTHLRDVAPVTARDLTVGQLLISNKLATRSIVVRREVQDRFPPLWHAEDLQLWLQILGSGKRGVVLGNVLAFSYRSAFAEGGLSGQLWRHEVQELRVLHEVRRLGYVSPPAWAAASVWSVAKYVRRVLIRAYRSER